MSYFYTYLGCTRILQHQPLTFQVVKVFLHRIGEARFARFDQLRQHQLGELPGDRSNAVDRVFGGRRFFCPVFFCPTFFVWRLSSANQELSLAANWKARGPPVPKTGLTRLLGCPKVNSFWLGGRPGVPFGLV